MSYRQLTATYLVSTACFVYVWLLWIVPGQAEDAAVTVEIASPPPLERIRPHTDLARVTLTAVVGEESGVAPLTAVLGLDVVALHPPMVVQIRMIALLLGVLIGGMVVGFCVPWTSKEPAGA